MSRKDAHKSNTQEIGIFADKKSSHYNKLILEALLSEELSAWKIAETLKEIIATTSKEQSTLEKRYHTQKIYSVIQRKSGRLNDLKSKGYINEHDGKWRLSTKGLIALCISKPDLVTSKLKKEFQEQFLKAMNEMPEELTMGMKVDSSNIKPYLDKMNQTKELEVIVEEAKMLISYGIELDRISERDLLGLIKGQKSFQNKVEKSFTNEG
jgi:hypothetical protein